MKNIKRSFLIITALFSLALVGCTTTPGSVTMTPAQLTTAVSVGVQVGLDVYPAATPDVALARDSICAAASSANTSPEAIVNDLAALNLTNSNSKLIVDSALLVYEGVYTAIGTNTTGQIQPYLTALCAGMTAGLPPATTTAKASRKLLPPHLR